MRFSRGGGVKGLIALFVLVLAGFLAATTLGSHNPAHPFAGKWTTSYRDAPVSGEIEFILVTDGTGPAQIVAAGGTPCEPNDDYYRGTFRRGSDTGTHIGCGKFSSAVPVLTARFHSNGFNVNGNFGLTLHSATSWEGGYYLDGDATIQYWTGTFADHVPGDGAEAPPACPTRARAGAEEPPSACPPPPKCLGKPATIVANDKNAGGGVLEGTDGDDVILGFPGRAMKIYGNGGNDRICGGAGDDFISGGDGNDHVSGGGGDDLLHGTDGNDRLLGGAGKDNLFGGEGVDALFGGPGDDVFSGGAGPDLLVGEGGDDDLYGLEGEDHAIGGPGDDRLYGGADDDFLAGGSGDDRLEGASGDDELDGGAGADSLYGGSRNDKLHGGPGFNKVFDGGPGSDTCRGSTIFLLGCEKWSP